MMTVRQIFNDGLSLLGIQNPDVSPLTARAHVLQDITAALQLMQLSGEDFYSREEMSVSLAIGTSAYVIDSSVQTVLDPATLSDGKALVELQEWTQFANFGPLFLGTNEAVANGIPLAYFVETLRPTTGTEATKIVLHVTPTPAAAYTLSLYVIKEPPVYTATDLGSSSPVPPVPHKYHESILLPLVRMNVTTCDLFARNAAKYPLIEADYQRALTLLGLADPRTPPPPGSHLNSLRKTAAAPGGQQQ